MTLTRFLPGCCLIVPLLLYSCDCLQYSRGVVLDSNTKLPVDSVCIQVENTINLYTYTDSIGNFTLEATSGSFLSRSCPPMKVFVAKPKYEIKSIELNAEKVDMLYLDLLQ